MLFCLSQQSQQQGSEGIILSTVRSSFLANKVGTALWSCVRVVIVGVQDPHLGYTPIPGQPPPSGLWAGHPPSETPTGLVWHKSHDGITWSSDGRWGRPAFTLTKRTCFKWLQTLQLKGVPHALNLTVPRSHTTLA